MMRKHGIGDGPCGDIPANLYEELHLTEELAEQAFERVHHQEEDMTEMTRLLKAS